MNDFKEGLRRGKKIRPLFPPDGPVIPGPVGPEKLTVDGEYTVVDLRSLTPRERAKLEQREPNSGREPGE